MKQEFEIPEGCKVTIELIGNQIITTFEPEGKNRVEEGEEYWYMDAYFRANATCETGSDWDDQLFNCGNYYLSPDDPELIKRIEINKNFKTIIKMKNGLIIDKFGDKSWYLNDKLHRVDGPAIECADGAKYWYLNGKYHRVDGPAIEYADGDKYWYLNDKLHRVDGPAIEYTNGTKYWYLNDKLHRVDGPAIEYTNGSKFWFLNDIKYTEEEFNQLKNKQNEIRR
jgi:hypothetical protein